MSNNVIEFIGKDRKEVNVLEGRLRLHNDLVRGYFEISNNNCDERDELHFMESYTREMRRHNGNKYILTPLFGTTLVYLPLIEDFNLEASTANLCLHHLKPNKKYSLNSVVELANKAKIQKLEQQEFEDLFNLSDPEKRSCITLNLQFPNNHPRESYIDKNIFTDGK